MSIPTKPPHGEVYDPELKTSPHFRDTTASPDADEDSAKVAPSSGSSQERQFPEDFPALPYHRYSEGELIARGGMSTIYKIYDHYFLRHIAMKVIDERLAHQTHHARRFLEEAQITGQLEHPNIIPVHNLGCNEDGFFYFTMKMIDGQTFEQYLRSEAHDLYSDASLYRTLQIFLKVCDAVSFAHSRGVLHRDLKPANIMVGEHGQVYVMDWGIAYLMPDKASSSTGDMFADKTSIFLQRDLLETHEQSGDILGTWNYMAPEQALGQTHLLDFHTDVFALGAILYEILTGHAPYRGNNAYEILQLAQKGEIVPPEQAVPQLVLPPGLSQIAMQALHPNPVLRYPNVTKLKEDIELFLRSGGQLPLRNYAPGELIIQEGGDGNAAYVITRGRCRAFRTIHDREVDLRDMGPGDVFGETSIFLQQKRTASVAAIDHVTLAVLDRQTLEQKLYRDSWLGRFIETLAQRFIDTDRKWTRQRQTLEQSQLLNHLLVYLCHTSPTHPPTAPWFPIAHNLCQLYECSEQELIDNIDALGVFTLDREQNTLSVTSSALHAYLHSHRISSAS